MLGGRSHAPADLFRDVGCGGEVKSLLAAEMIGNCGQIGAGRAGKGARAGALVAAPAEDIDRGIEKPLPGLLAAVAAWDTRFSTRSEEHTSELQSLMRLS